MKRTFVSTLLLCSTLAALGQGTVEFSNIALFRLSLYAGAGLANPVLVPADPGLFEYGLFYGIGESTSLTVLTSQFGVNSTSSAGLIANPADSASPMVTVPIPGTNPGETDVWVQVAGWSASYGTNYVAAHQAFLSLNTSAWWGQSGIANINALGPTGGPGVAIWTFSTGTNPHLLQAFTFEQLIPEPASLALVGLGAATLLIFRKRRVFGQ
jgi:hypothetical protein